MAIFTDDRMAQLAYLDRSLDEDKSYKLLKDKMERVTINMPEYFLSQRERAMRSEEERNSVPMSECVERINSLEQKFLDMNDYLIDASKTFTLLTNKIEQLEKALDEERQNRLRDNGNWGTF